MRNDLFVFRSSNHPCSAAQGKVLCKTWFLRQTWCPTRQQFPAGTPIILFSWLAIGVVIVNSTTMIDSHSRSSREIFEPFTKYFVSVSLRREVNIFHTIPFLPFQVFSGLNSSLSVLFILTKLITDFRE
jgi:hypothetical protein